MSQNYIKLKEKLLELFMLDQPELDFGIYRIMNSKRQEIIQFLDNDLLPQVKTAFAQYRDADKSKIETDIQKAIQQAQELGVDPESSPKVKELRAKIIESVDLAALEEEVYSDLYNFFRRYYKEGDFLSLRRYKEGVYAIPYEGEEVKLYWANHDQYYIKTSEYLRDYTFNLPNGKKVHFKLTEADIEKDNRKANGNQERLFVLAETDFADEENGQLIIRFAYIPCEKGTTQKNLIEQAIKKIFEANGIDNWLGQLSAKAPTEKNPNRTILEKHLNDYTARNTFDYFIHKDLGGFLKRELDFYIKNEIMHLDDVENETLSQVEQYLSKIKIIRAIAHKIINFVEQLENFQKKLWLKKKIVVETNYCMTLDRIPENLYAEIAANDAQINEWIYLYGIDNIEGEKGNLVEKDKPSFSRPLKTSFLKANPLLVLDTKFFDDNFKSKLLSTIDNIDKQLNGILVQSENQQALNMLAGRYKSAIKCTYIDPPFNLGENPDYLYKVDYKDSTWISLLRDRIGINRYLLEPNGCVFVRCSHDGNMMLRMLLNNVMGDENYRNEIIVRRAEESKGDLNKQFSTTRSITVNYDNIYWYSNKSDARFGRFLKPTNEKQSKSHWHSFWKAEDRANLRYEILGVDLSKHYGQWMWKKTRAFEAVENYKKYLEINAKTSESLDDYWRRTVEKLEFVKKDGDGDRISTIKYWIPPRTEVMADNNWLDVKGYSNHWKFKTENSEPLLKRIIESITEVNDYVLDYFLGSGTTCVVAHKLNRKWLGVEMGEHFDTFILPRLKYVLNGETSGISKETNWKGGGFFKYIRLESYEDSLNNLILKRTAQQDNLLAGNAEFRESYMLGYMLDTESAASASLLNIDAFKDPFNYKLNIATGSVGETKPVNVDLVETFNYLLGLRVKHIDTIRGFRVIEGFNPKDEKVLIIWRNTEEKSNEELEAFFLKQHYNTQDMEFDLIYINGDNNLENLKKDEDTWKVRLIEEEFKRLMFDVQDVK